MHGSMAVMRHHKGKRDPYYMRWEVLIITLLNGFSIIIELIWILQRWINSEKLQETIQTCYMLCLFEIGTLSD